MAKNFPDITPDMISKAVNSGLDTMYRELQEVMFPEGEADGGVAAIHYCSGECDDLKETLSKFMTRYVELERMYAPETSPLDTAGMRLDEVLSSLGWTWEKSSDPRRPGNRVIDCDGIDYGIMHACDVWNLLRDQKKIV